MDFMVHTSSHREFSPETRFKCSRCNADFVYPEDLNHHRLKKCHGRGDLGFLTEIEDGLRGANEDPWTPMAHVDIRPWERFQTRNLADEAVDRVALDRWKSEGSSVRKYGTKSEDHDSSDSSHASTKSCKVRPRTKGDIYNK